MELSYGEMFLLAWSLASSIYAIMLRERHRKFVLVGSIALEAVTKVLEDVVDKKIELKRDGDKLEIIKLTGEEHV